MGLALAALGILVTQAKAKIVASSADINLVITNLSDYFLQSVRNLT
jgi:hypothetical protein